VSHYTEALEADAGDRPDILEGLLDSTVGTVGPKSWTPTEAVRAVLEELSTVCSSKEENIAAQYGVRDPDARAWRQLANRLSWVAARLKP
jgi:hypothetical protein